MSLLDGYMWLESLLYWLIALAGVVGAVLAATTRDDAYPAAGRQGKWIWVAILVASAFVVFTRFPFLSWAGIVAIGVYFFDVRPQIRNIVSGNYGW
ncbi:DUF2516 family protein [Corynebacterium guangdongense]